MTDKVRIDTVDAHKSNETYLARQAEFESNVRSYPRKLPLAITKQKACGSPMQIIKNTLTV